MKDIWHGSVWYLHPNGSCYQTSYHRLLMDELCCRGICMRVRVYNYKGLIVGCWNVLARVGWSSGSTYYICSRGICNHFKG